jgi:hypothetical protein
MVKHPVPRAPDSSKPDRPTKAVTHEPQASPEQLQAIAHSRGRICKKRNCKVCEPLRETRRLKKAQRKADAQAKLHAKGQPCGRNSCELDVCVAARNAAPPAEAPAPPRSDVSNDDPAEAQHRQAERHRIGLACGVESCPNEQCVEGFAQERVRRHRARRPCKSLECDNPICVASRSNR